MGVGRVGRGGRGGGGGGGGEEGGREKGGCVDVCVDWILTCLFISLCV